MVRGRRDHPPRGADDEEIGGIVRRESLHELYPALCVLSPALDRRHASGLRRILVDETVGHPQRIIDPRLH